MSEDKWKNELTPEQYQILRQKGTEAAFSGQYYQTKDKGKYSCAACGADLFSSDTKFDSETGWPSFDQAIPKAIKLIPDNSHGVQRTEVVCAKCGSHLGHVFNDGPTQTGQRYCINSICLNLKKEKMNNKIKSNNILLIIVSLIMIVGLSYYFSTIYNSSHLDIIEINEYEGQDLSSINDFRENSIKGPQYINKNSYQLEIKGLVENPESFTYDEIINNFPSQKKVVKLNCVEGWSVTILWEGIVLRDLFDQVKPTDQVKTIIFRAVDGYSTSFPLSYFDDHDILMVYKMNDTVLPPERGFPFQLVAESKWGYKWIKWITEIEFSADENLQGYWEQRGYSDSGNLDQSFLD